MGVSLEQHDPSGFKHAIFFRNENDSAMSIKTLKNTITANIQISVGIAADPEKAVVMYQLK